MCEQSRADGDSYSLATSYRIIRKRLDNLGYRQALSVDTLPLVEKLLGDLIKTTESLRHFKAIAQDKIEISSGHQEFSADPYKCDNVKLVAECNKLNGELLECRENQIKQTKELKKKINTLEAECSNLQLASSRNLKRIKDLETESSNKSKRIQELLGKCCKPTVSNSGLIAKKRSVFPLRKPTINGDILTEDLLKGSIGNITKNRQEIVDLVAMGDRKINSLNHEVIKLKGELELQYDNVHTLKSQLAMKGKEINRLKKMLEGGRPYLAVSKDCSCHSAEPNCIPCTFTSKKNSRCPDAALNEIKVLQQVKSNLEQQLREALEKQHDAMSQAMKLAERNEELEKELRDIDHIALAVEADCNSTVKENNYRVTQLQEKLETTMGRVHRLENDLLVEKRASQELRADLEACKLEKKSLQRALDSATDEKKQLTDRINQLTMIENSLNKEIDRLSRLNETQKHEIAQLACVNESLKMQMSNESSQILSRNCSRVTKDKTDKNDKNQGALTKKKNGQRRSFSPPVREKGSTESERAKKTIQEKDERIIELQNSMDKLRREKESYREEMERLKKESGADNALWSQICDLKHQLNDKEMRISELQREKRELCKEKFELESRLQGCRNRTSPCSICNQCRSVGPCVCLSLSPPPPETAGSKAFLSRLERERDTARSDVERLTQEREILREKLKMATEAHTCEQRRLRDNVRELEKRLEEIERERKEHLIAQGTRRTAIAGLEDQLEEAREELRRTKQELASHRTQYFQLRALQDQTDQALGDVQSQLSQSENELSKAMERNRCLEQQQTQLDNQVRELKQEINTLRTSMARLDQEKDQLLVELDNKTERISSLEREILTREQQTIGTEQQLRELQHKYQICTDQSAEQERQLRSLQMEMENNQRQLAAASADRENAAQENRRLQDDLAALTCEIRTLQRELESSRAESYDLKRQLQTYVSEVRRAEELLNRKENERTEMLNHFRSLSLEATVLENNNHSLESEAAEARGALQSARDRLLDLERQLADKDCLIRGYEAQITELTQNIASLESQVRQQTEQRARTEADLNAVRDLCVQLDQQKEKLMMELGDRDAMKSQYEAQISRLRAEQNMAQEQVNRDHVTVDRMEQLLDQARQESMECRAQNQELHNEMTRMKQRICELQNKLSAECAELRRYQNQAAEYSKQVSELRRQVTNERFDRARKEEEHRRYQPSTLQSEFRPLPVSPDTPETRRIARTIQGNTYKDPVQMEEDHTIVQLRGPKNGETTHQTVSVPGRGSLCISTTLQENDERNNLNVKITDAEAMGETSKTKTTASESVDSSSKTREEMRGEDNLQEDLITSPVKKANNKKACGCDISVNLPNCPGVESNDPKLVKDSSKKNSNEKSVKTGEKSQKNEKRSGNLEEKRIQEENFDDDEEIQQLTNPGFIKLLEEMKEYTKNLNNQMAMMNSVMQSQNSHSEGRIFPDEPIDFDGRITYRRTETTEEDDNYGKIEDIEGMKREHFIPSTTSTPKKQVDFNDNIVDDENIPVVVTSEKRVCYKRRNPARGAQKVEHVTISTSVVDDSNERKRKKKSVIPAKLFSKNNKEVASSNLGNSSFHAVESHSHSFPDDASSVRIRSCSFKSAKRDRSKSSSRSHENHSNKRDAVTQDSPVFHSLPEHSYHSETRSYKSGQSRSHCNREECL